MIKSNRKASGADKNKNKESQSTWEKKYSASFVFSVIDLKEGACGSIGRNIADRRFNRLRTQAIPIYIY
jgi:hypothetical protein